MQYSTRIGEEIKLILLSNDYFLHIVSDVLDYPDDQVYEISTFPNLKKK